jgi:hypothetical protein
VNHEVVIVQSLAEQFLGRRGRFFVAGRTHPYR